ncbi:MAG TPA: HAMP domain-containing sensor histidine kinase [Planctomycetota bacterium]|nr:HAMP domain-containing sensor histidine kinase [Planctomycetota bacterium]
MPRLPLRILVIGSIALTAVTGLVMREAILVRGLEGTLTAVDDVLRNALPSMDDLSSMRGDLRLMLFLSGESSVIETPDDAEDVARRSRAILTDLGRHLDAYVALPKFPGEAERQGDLVTAIERVRGAAVLLTEATDAELERLSDARVRDAVREAEEVIESLRILNSQGAARAAHAVVERHDVVRRVGFVFVGGALAALLAIALVAERRLARAEVRIERQIAELEAFASRTAHDLKGPLSPALLGVALLRREPRLGEGAADTLATIERAHRRLVAIIDGLLAFARASGAATMPGESVAIADVVGDVAPALEALAREENARITFDVEPGLRAAASRTVLGSIVDNLARNGLLYLGESSRREVRVTARSEATATTIEVADTGPGIGPELRARLFRPFERGSARAGTGLGLATVKRLVEAHGGEIALRTEPGAGTTFVVRLPRTRSG